MTFLRGQYEKLTEFIEERRRRRERLKERIDEGFRKCILFLLKPIWWLLKVVLWPVLKPVLWPVLKPVGKVLGAHFEWLQKRRILTPALYFYTYFFICVLGYFSYNPSEDRATFRSQHVRMVVYDSESTATKSSSGPPRRPATSSLGTPRRPASHRSTRRQFWLPNLGVILRQSVERNLMEQELELEMQRQAKLAAEAKTSQQPNPAAKPKAPLKQQTGTKR